MVFIIDNLQFCYHYLYESSEKLLSSGGTKMEKYQLKQRLIFILQFTFEFLVVKQKLANLCFSCTHYLQCFHSSKINCYQSSSLIHMAR